MPSNLIKQLVLQDTKRNLSRRNIDRNLSRRITQQENVYEEVDQVDLDTINNEPPALPPRTSQPSQHNKPDKPGQHVSKDEINNI